MLPVPFCALVNDLLLRPPRGPLPPVPTLTSGWLAVGAAGLLLGLGIWRRRRLRSSPPLPPLLPGTLARRSLAALQDRPETGALVTEVSQIVRLYLRAIIGRASEELTTEELLLALETHCRANPDTRHRLREFLHRCDAVRFAPAPSALPAALVSQALQLIARFESDGSDPTRPSADKAAELPR
jgi:hypothetical protein